MPTPREQYLADVADFDRRNKLLDEEYRRMRDVGIIIEELIKQRVSTRQGIKQLDATEIKAKLDDIRTKLAEIIQLRNG